MSFEWTGISFIMILFPWIKQLVIFKPLNYCFKETIGFDVIDLFASPPSLRLIRWYNKPCDSVPQDLSWIENYKLKEKSRSKSCIKLRFYESTHPKGFYKKGVLKKITKLTGKHLCWNVFLNKVACLRLATILKKETSTRVFSCEFWKFF